MESLQRHVKHRHLKLLLSAVFLNFISVKSIACLFFFFAHEQFALSDRANVIL